MRHQVLDEGYIELVEHWGSDERIIEAARMSTDKGFQGWGPTCKHCGGPAPRSDLAVTVVCRARAPQGTSPTSQDYPHEYVPGDEKLLRYLWVNKHATPFEMAGAIIEVQAPIFVFREWHRHRTQSFNELSARYTPMPDINYLPTVERLTGEDEPATKNRQAGTAAGVGRIGWDDARDYSKRLASFYDEAESFYQEGLRLGVPKELARLCIPVARYSRMRAMANLRNWLAFLTLRNHSAAQREIREYAAVLQTILAERFPRTVALFAENQ